MQKLGTGDRVFVILNEKYLQSPYCMAELFEVWKNSKENKETFRQHIRAYSLEKLGLDRAVNRIERAAFWKEEYDKIDSLVKKHGASVLGEEDLRQFHLMQSFASRVGDILALITDILQPTTLDELVAHGFAD